MRTPNSKPVQDSQPLPLVLTEQTSSRLNDYLKYVCVYFPANALHVGYTMSIKVLSVIPFQNGLVFPRLPPSS
jgi:hypothetical protein